MIRARPLREGGLLEFQLMEQKTADAIDFYLEDKPAANREKKWRGKIFSKFPIFVTRKTYRLRNAIKCSFINLRYCGLQKKLSKGFALILFLLDGFRCALDMFQRAYPPGYKTFYKCFGAFPEAWQRCLLLGHRKKCLICMCQP